MNYLTLLFQRFGEIYGTRAGLIEGTPDEWARVIHGCSGADIKKALDTCREDTEVLITMNIFSELVDKKSKAENVMLHVFQNHIKSQLNISDYKPIEPPPSIPYKDSELMAMDDKTASTTLSGEQAYDRSRLLMERDGTEQVKRYEAMAPVPKEEKNGPKKFNGKTVSRDYY